MHCLHGNFVFLFSEILSNRMEQETSQTLCKSLQLVSKSEYIARKDKKFPGGWSSLVRDAQKEFKLAVIKDYGDALTGFRQK